MKIEGLHTGNHKNSIEYDRMITAFKMVAEYPTNATYADILYEKTSIRYPMVDFANKLCCNLL